MLHLDDLVLLVAKCLNGFTHFVIITSTEGLKCEGGGGGGGEKGDRREGTGEQGGQRTGDRREQ